MDNLAVEVQRDKKNEVHTPDFGADNWSWSTFYTIRLGYLSAFFRCIKPPDMSSAVNNVHSPPLSNVHRLDHPWDLIYKCYSSCDVIQHFDISNLFPWHRQVLQQLQHCMRHVFQCPKINKSRGVHSKHTSTYPRYTLLSWRYFRLVMSPWSRIIFLTCSGGMSSFWASTKPNFLFSLYLFDCNCCHFFAVTCAHESIRAREQATLTFFLQSFFWYWRWFWNWR